MEGIDHDADNLGAVGEVDVRVIALAAAHGSGVDGVAFRQIVGDGSGVLPVDVSVFHFCIPIYNICEVKFFLCVCCNATVPYAICLVNGFF